MSVIVHFNQENVQRFIALFFSSKDICTQIFPASLSPL